jgi:catalase
VFFIRDAIKFPDFIHSQKRLPGSGLRDADMQWDFWTLSPESAHQVTYLMGDRGLPKSWREMQGYGSHTYQWINAAGEKFWVKYHFRSQQGDLHLDAATAEAIAGADADFYRRDLHDAIERGEFPKWDLHVQVMPYEDAKTYRFNPFDLTKVWLYEDYPLIEVGKLVLDRNPDNYFADVEQAAFDPGHFVPGVGPSPDKMLQARLFAYGDAHRYRLGVNHTQLPVNAPLGVPGGTTNYGRDGAMRFDENGGRAKNYEPNSFDGPRQTGSGSHAPVRHVEDDEFVQAGMLYRVMKQDERERLVANIAGSLAQVRHGEIVSRSIAHFRAADPDYGARVEAAVKDRA